VATANASYTLAWSGFDNAMGTATGSIQETRAAEPRAVAPAVLLEGSQFVRVAVRTTHPDHPAWSTPVTFTFRRTGNGWQTVGLARNPSARK